MKMIISLLFIMYLLMFCSYDNGKINKSLNLEDCLHKRTQFKLSDLVKNTDIIVLDTITKSLLVSIQKVIILPDNILILDGSNVNPGIFLFDLKGKFYKQIGGIGNGPGEYTKVLDISVDKDKKLIYAMTGNNRKLVIYNFNGVYLGHEISVDNYLSFISYNEKFYFHYPSNYSYKRTDTPFQLIIKNKNDSIISKYHPVNTTKRDYLNPFLERAYFSTSRKGIFYNITKENVLYDISDGELTPYVSLSFGKFELDENFVWDYKNYQKVKNLNKVFINKILTGRDLVFIFYNKSNEKGLILLKDSKIHNVGFENESGFTDDIDGLGYINDFFVQDSVIIQVINPASVKDLKNSCPFSKRGSNIITSLNEFDNYILRIGWLKDN